MGDLVGESKALSHVGTVLLRMERREAANAYLRDRLTIAQKLSDQATIITIL